MSELASIIRGRRSIRAFSGPPVTQQQVMDILEAAVWAPFHAVKEPWRFILFAGDGRKRFAEAVLGTLSLAARIKNGGKLQAYLTEEVSAHLIVVMNQPSFPAEREQQRQWDDAFGATCALIQNIQLLAWEQNIGAVWKTNPYNWDPHFCEAVGVTEDEKVVGTLHLGSFDQEALPEAKPRTPAAELTTIVR